MSDSQPTGRLTTLLASTGRHAWDEQAVIAAPLCLHQATVQPQWVDYNGHMSESFYLLVFGNNSDAFFRFIGIDEDYRDRGGHSLYTVQTHLHHLREADQGEPLRLTLQLLDLDEKRVHIFHSMLHGSSGVLLATAEQMLVHVDMRLGRSAPLPGDLHRRLLAVHAAHSTLAIPPQVGRTIEIRRKPAGVG